MLITKPDYFDQFRCIAGKIPVEFRRSSIYLDIPLLAAAVGTGPGDAAELVKIIRLGNIHKCTLTSLGREPFPALLLSSYLLGRMVFMMEEASCSACLLAETAICSMAFCAEVKPRFRLYFSLVKSSRKPMKPKHKDKIST